MRVIIKNVKRILDDYFKVDQATLQYEKFNGEMSRDLIRLNFIRGHSVALLLYNKDTNSIILTQQFRYPVHSVDEKKAWLWEIIAGSIENGETAIQTLLRESLEEAGYQIQHPEFVNEFFVSPGGTSEKISLYYAEVTDADRIGTGGGMSSEGENLKIEEVPLQQAFQMMETGEICDAKSIIALLWLKNRLFEEKKDSPENPDAISHGCKSR